MQLYKAYSLIPSSRLTGLHEEEDIRIDWVCYFRDENLPCEALLENFDDLLQAAEMNEDREYLRWIQQRTNNLLKGEEIEELEEYLQEKYEFPIYIENMRLPVKPQDLPWFKENHINSMIILSGRDDPFTLSTCIVGMVSPYKNVSGLFTVREFLNEINKQRSSEQLPGEDAI